jgi:hypothetical protein
MQTLVLRAHPPPTPTPTPTPHPHPLGPPFPRSAPLLFSHPQVFPRREVGLD